MALALERFGRLDHLVNNAAINPQYGPLMEADLGAVRKIFDVNVTAALGWTQQAWRAALIHLTRQLASELGPKVRVNAIAPAVVKTDFAKALYEGREEEVAAAYPLKRLGVPADTSKAAAFLLSAEASWITGETLVVDGGVTVGR